MRGVETFSRRSSLSRGKRDRDLERVQILYEKRDLHAYREKKAERAFQGSAAQTRLSGADAEMDRRNWEKGNAADIAFYETIRQLESQRLKFFQANQWADQAQKQTVLSTKNRIDAKDCQEIDEELRRICCKQADRVRQPTNHPEQQKENPSTVNQLVSQLQDKVNPLHDGKEFCDPKTAEKQVWNVPRCHSSRMPSPRGMISRDSCLPHNSRNSMGTSGNDFEDLPAQGGPSPAFFENPRNLAVSSCGLRPGNTRNTLNHGEGVRREPQSSAILTPRFSRKYETWDPLYRTGGTYSQNCMMEAPRCFICQCISEGSSDSNDFERRRVHFETEVCANTPFPQLTMSWINEVEL